MDDIFDSLIYIIITLAAFVISTLGKKKKKNRTNVAPVSEDQSPQKEGRPLFSNLEKLLNEELGLEDTNYTNEADEEVELKPEPESVEKMEKPLDFVPPEMLDEKEDIPYSIEYEDTSEVFKDSIKDDELSDNNEEDVLPNFNLEDAIIYSEILNRKEY